MSWRALRPVGEPLVRPASAQAEGRLVPEGYRARWVNSGTAALTLSLLAIRSGAAPARRRILLPAYGCPDLVSAVLGAGLVPSLLDTAREQPFIDKALLERELADDVLAVVGVHFLGLAEDIAALQRICGPAGITVVEDSAQRLTGAGGLGPVADWVVMSFGRGKPAGGLGGGVLLVRDGTAGEESLGAGIAAPRRNRVPVSIRRRLFNFLIRPEAYGVLVRVPGLGLGETVYRAPEAIRELDGPRRRLAETQWGWTASMTRAPMINALRNRLEGLDHLRDLSRLGVQASRGGLLRFPLLCSSSAQRDALHGRLQGRGLGSSVMYGKALPDLPGVPHCSSSEVESARDFAARLLTLPVHGDVTTSDLERITDCLRAAAPLGK